MPEAARHFVECAWLSHCAPRYIDITTAAAVSSSAVTEQEQDNAN